MNQVNLAIKDKEFEAYYKKTIKERAKILQAAYKNQDLQLLLLKKCEEDIVFFFNYFIVTFNPRVKPSVIPMVLFPKQVEMLRFFERCYEENKWGIVNKCRYTGASVLSIGFLLQKFLFQKDFSGSLSSNKAESVDKLGDPDCLFTKLEQMYDHLPSWMKPFTLANNRKLKLFSNPTNGSTIKGYSGKSIGRGGRSSIAVIDEIAHIEQDEAAIAAMSENTDCMIGVSTPKGKDTQHYELFIKAEEEGSTILNFTYPWTADPRRDEQWADEQRLKLGDEIFEQELGCSFDAFTGNSYLPKDSVKYFFDHTLPIVVPEAHMAQNTRYGGLDLANGGDKTILAILEGNEIIAIHELDKDIDIALEELHGLTIQYDLYALAYDQCGLGQLFSSLANKHYPNGFPAELEAYNAAGTQDIYIEAYEKRFKDVFYNNRAYYYHRLYCLANNTKNYYNGRLTLEQTEYDYPILRLPKIKAVQEDLIKPSAEYKGGKLLIQSKADMRKLGLTSTDWSDSIICALYAKDMYD